MNRSISKLPNASANILDSVAGRLALACKRHGVTLTFGQSLPSAFHIAASRLGIRQIAYRAENAGGCMADGYARIARKVGIVTAQNGPAATLLVAPLAEALKASVPVVAIVQDVAMSMVDKNAFQEIDHLGLFRPCTKWVRRVEVADRIDDFVDMAFAAALTGRLGPAALIMPIDLLNETVATPAIRRSELRCYPLDRCAPDPARVEEVADILASAKAPLIVAGGGVHLSDASAELHELMTTYRIPVATTTMGKGSVSEAEPLALGVIGQFMGPGGASRYLRHMIDQADVIFFIGSRTNQNGTDSWKLFPQSARYIHLDIDGLEVGRNYDSVRLVGDAKLGLRALAAAMSKRDPAVRLKNGAALEGLIAEGRRHHLAEVLPLLKSEAVPLRPERIMAELNEVIPDTAIVVGDASYSSIWTTNFLKARLRTQRFITPRGLAGLGWGFPMALGAKAAHPEATVICVAGDGGFAHCWAEVETSVREALPVILLVLNNSLLGFQKHMELVRFSEYTSAVHLGRVDHAAIARACGADGITLERPGDIRAVLAAAIASNRTTVIDVITEPDAYPPLTAFENVVEKFL